MYESVLEKERCRSYTIDTLFVVSMYAMQVM